MKPEETAQLTPNGFVLFLGVFVGTAFAKYLMNKGDSVAISRTMGGLNQISIDDPNDETKSIGAYEHPEYHNVMGELLRRWKAIA